MCLERALGHMREGTQGLWPLFVAFLLGGSGGEGVQLLGGVLWVVLFLIDRLGLCKPVLTMHILSHNASDSNHIYAQLCMRG